MYETPFSLSWTMIGKIWSCATSSNGRNTWSSYHRIKSDVIGGLALEMKKKWIGKIRQDQISDLKIYIAMYKFWLSSCILSCKVEKILKGSQDSIPSPSHSMKIQIMCGKVCLRCKRQNIARSCQQIFENKKFFDNPQQCFTLLPQVHFPANNLNLYWRWRD